MIYRILAAPPGYPSSQSYWVVAYETLEYNSSVRRPDGITFAGSLEEARSLLPADARQLHFEPEYQFLELWEAGGGTAEEGLNPTHEGGPT